MIPKQLFNKCVYNKNSEGQLVFKEPRGWSENHFELESLKYMQSYAMYGYNVTQYDLKTVKIVWRVSLMPKKSM